jgi:hypothetical protein
LVDVLNDVEFWVSLVLEVWLAVVVRAVWFVVLELLDVRTWSTGFARPVALIAILPAWT